MRHHVIEKRVAGPRARSDLLVLLPQFLVLVHIESVTLDPKKRANSCPDGKQ